MVGYAYKQVCLGQECFSSLIIIPITYRYEKDTVWTNTIKHVTVYINVCLPPESLALQRPCPPPGLDCKSEASLVGFLKELLQEETSAEEEYRDWLNAGFRFVTRDLVQLGERVELSISHMVMKNSSLAT